MVAPDRPQKTIIRRKDAIGMPDSTGRNTDTHVFNTSRGADKSLARPGRKQATATKF